MHIEVENYLASILSPQLFSFMIDGDFTERIIHTVREQILSCLFHWNDERFRKALLLIGSEEGAYYLPHASDDIRNFVVIAIRNSEIETIQSKNYAAAGLRREINSDDVKAITSAAVEYFGNLDFSALAERMESSAADKYGALATKHPAAWRALIECASMRSQIHEYEKVSTPIFYNVASLPLQNEAMNRRGAGHFYVVGDGYSFSADSMLLSAIRECASEPKPFVSDSFKSLTRNIEKLLAIIEYLLHSGAPFVTSNYYLSNGHVERRKKPLKAGSDYDAFVENWMQTKGLGPRHKAALNATTLRP